MKIWELWFGEKIAKITTKFKGKPYHCRPQIRTPMKAKTKLAFQSLKPTLLFSELYFQAIYLDHILNCHITYTIKAFDLIPKLRARPKLQLSSGTKCLGVSLLNLAWPRFLSSSTTFGYARPWWATLKHSQLGYGLNAKKHWKKLAWRTPMKAKIKWAF